MRRFIVAVVVLISLSMQGSLAGATDPLAGAPPDVAAAIIEASAAHGVPLARAACTMRRESGFRLNAVNGIHRGLGQHRADRWLGRVAHYNSLNALQTPNADWQDPRTMALVSVWYMRHKPVFMQFWKAQARCW